jgi:flagellar biosynthetic protein FlhB
MADQNAQDKSLPATPRKIAKAREDGQVARSRDLSHLAAFVMASGLVLGAGPWVLDWMGQEMARSLRFGLRELQAPGAMLERLGSAGQQFALLVLPLGSLMLLAAIAAGVAVGGWNFTLKAAAPKLEKMSPLAGIKRMFSLQQLGDTAKGCLLALGIGVLGLWLLADRLPLWQQALSLPLPAGLRHLGSVLGVALALLLLLVAAFALVDVPLQRFLHLKRLRMSFEELKKEQKDVEGNVEVKGKMKLRMREMANRRMLAQVPKADLIVMNPSHYAVALKYDEATMAAPRVVAKGMDLMALRIRDAARGAQVPVLQAPPLARALYAHAQIDREIPAALFAAVAQVLAWVYQLRAAMAGQAPQPAALPEVQVPPGLDPQDKQAGQALNGTREGEPA